MKCQACRKERNEPLSYTDRLKAWVLKHLTDELADTKADSFTSGFGQGYEKGFAEAQRLAEERFALQKMMFERDSIPLAFQVNLHDVVDSKAGTLYLNGRKASDDEVLLFKNEADSIKRMRLWEIMQETVKQKMLEKAVLTSKNWEECLAGKMGLHTLGLLRSILDAVEKSKITNVL